MSRNTSSAVFVAGHQGMVGSALVKRLCELGYTRIITAPRASVDLTNQASVGRFFREADVDVVYLAAARVGGIHANNTYPAEFIYQNLMIECNVIHAAHEAGVQKLLFLGSSCIYPRLAPQPIPEEALLIGELEATNEPYAIAKIAGIKMCESYNRQYGRDYRSVMPTNLYGPHDNFHPENSHVIPSLMRRFHEAKLAGAKSMTVWGSGNAMREFLHVDDMGAACIHLMEIDRDAYASQTRPLMSHVNVGTGIDCTIRELAKTMAKVIGFRGRIEFDFARPDGAPRKLLNVSRLRNLGWESRITLEQGLRDTYEWFIENEAVIRR